LRFFLEFLEFFGNIYPIKNGKFENKVRIDLNLAIGILEFFVFTIFCSWNLGFKKLYYTYFSLFLRV